MTQTAPPASAAPSAFTGPRRRVGIVSFENKSAYGQSRIGGAAADILLTELAKTGKFIIVEREKLDKVFAEQRLGQTGAVDEQTAAQTGKLLGLNAVVIGSISNFGMSAKGTDYIVGQRKSQTATAAVDVRVVDAESAKVLYAESGQGESSLTAADFLGMGTKAGYDERLEGDALRAAIGKVASNVASKIDEGEWTCRVALVQQSGIYLDAGKDSGLKIGQRLKVYRLGEVVKSPQTGLPIGRAQEYLGDVTIIDYFGDNGSIAKPASSGPAPATGDLAKLAE